MMNKAILLKIFSIFLAVLSFTAPAEAGDDTAFNRIKETSRIRCGYMPWPSLLEIDPSTNAFSGLVVDYMDKIAKAAHLTYTWETEMSTQSYITDLDNDKVDIACGALAGGAEVGFNVYFTEPLFYAVINTYVHDAKKFGHPESLKTEGVRFAVVEGSAVEGMMKNLYPKATYVTVSQLQGATQALMDVVTGKADAIVMDSMTVGTYVANNPGALVAVNQPPLSVIGASMAVSTKETKLLASLNMIIHDLKDKGVINQLMANRGLTGYLTTTAP